MTTKKDFTFWLLLPCVLLALSGVSLLAHPRAASASPADFAPVNPVLTKPASAAATDDDDGDELLEHWGDPKYAGEAWSQMAGMTGGFAVLGGFALRRRARRASANSALGPAAPLPTQADFLKLGGRAGTISADTQKTDAQETDSRKAA